MSRLAGAPALDAYLHNSLEVVQYVSDNMEAIKAVAGHLTPVEDLVDFKQTIDELHGKLALLVEASELLIQTTPFAIQMLLAPDAAAERKLLELGTMALLDAGDFVEQTDFKGIANVIDTIKTDLDGLLPMAGQWATNEQLTTAIKDIQLQIDDPTLSNRVGQIFDDLASGKYTEGLKGQVIGLQQRMTAAENGIDAQATNVVGLTAEVQRLGDEVTSQAQRTTLLTTDIDNLATGQQANSTSLETLNNRATTLEGLVAAEADKITSLTTQVGEHDGQLTATGSAVQALQTRVEQTEASQISTSNLVTVLVNDLHDVKDSVDANTIAQQGLITSVENIEGQVSSFTQDMTQLQASVVSGGNLAPNAGFENNTRDWEIFSRGAGWAQAYLTLPSDTGKLPNKVSALCVSVDGQPTGTLGIRCTDIPASARQRYIASGYLAAMGCTLRLEWRVFDATGKQIGMGAVGTVTDQMPGGNLVDWDRAFDILTTSADAATVQLQLWISACTAEMPHIWFARPMFEEAVEKQTQPSPWALGTGGLEKSVAGAMQSLTARVDVIDGKVTSQASSITALNTQTSDLITKTTAQGSALDALTSRTTDIEGKQEVTNAAVTALTGRVTNTETNITAGANATTALTTRVTNAEGKLTSQATSISQLQVDVGANTAAITAEQTARASADASEANSRQMLSTQLTGGYTGSDLNAVTSGLIGAEKNARSTQYEGLAQQMTQLSAGVGEQFDYAQMWYFTDTAEGWTSNGTTAALVTSASWAMLSGTWSYSPAALGINGSEYTQVRFRIRKTGKPVWGAATKLGWQKTGDSGYTYGTAIPEPTWDANGIGMVTIPMAWGAKVDRLQLSLTNAVTATDYYSFDWFAVGRPAPGASSAALSNEAIARATAVTAEVTARQQLAVKMTGVADPSGSSLGSLSSGLIYDERTARISADDANATSISALQVSLGQNSAAITSEQTARTTADTALGTRIDAVTASYGQDPSNMVPNPSAATDLTQWVGTNLLRVATTDASVPTGAPTAYCVKVTARDTTLGRTLPCKAGDRFYASMSAAMMGSGTTQSIYPIAVGIQFVLADGSKNWMQTKQRAASDAPGTWTQLTSEIVAPANAVSACAWIQHGRPTGAFSDAYCWFITQVDVRPASAISGVRADLTTEQTARATADTALGTRIDNLTATVGGNTAAITAEQTARASGDSANAASIIALNSSITSTGNLLPNPGFDVDTHAWSIFSRGTGWLNAQLQRDLDPTRIPPGLHLMGVTTTGVPSGTLGIRSTRLPISAAAKYLLSGYLAAENCTLAMEWHTFDAAGNQVAQGTVATVANKSPVATLKDWARSFIAMAASGTAVLIEVQLWVSGCNTAAPKVWFLRPMMEEVVGVQTVPSPWVPGVTSLEEAMATAVSDLSTRVESTEQGMLSQANSLTSLQARLGNVVTWRAVAIAGSGSAASVNAPMSAGLRLTAKPTNVTALATPFGAPNGTDKVFQLQGPAGSLIVRNPLVTAIYRADWQGKQKLSDKPRTNLCPWSTQISKWTKTGVGGAAVAVVTDNYALAPDGTMTASRVQLALNGNGANTAQSGVNISPVPLVGTTRRFAILIKANTGTPTVQLRYGGATALINCTSSWQNSGVAYTMPASGGDGTSPLVWLRGGAGTSDTADILLTAVMLEDVATTATPGTAVIQTNGAAGTVTDYTVAPTGLVTLSEAPLKTAALSWDGTGDVENNALVAFQRGLTLVRFTPGGDVASATLFDTYASTTERANLTAALNALGPNDTFLLASGNNHGAKDPALNTAMERCGATTFSTVTGSRPYALRGRGGIGKGGGIENYPTTESQFIDFTFTTINEMVQGLGEQSALAGVADAVQSMSAQVTDIAGQMTAVSQANTALATRTDNSEASLVNELIIRAQRTSLLSASINAFDGRLTSAETKVTVAANTVAAYDTRMSNAEGNISSQSTKSDKLSNDLTTLDGKLTATNTAAATLSSKVDAQGTTITSQGSAITSLNSTVNDSKTGLAATATGLSGLTTRVTNAEGVMTTQASQISRLNAQSGINLVADGSFENKLWDISGAPTRFSYVASARSGNFCLQCGPGAGNIQAGTPIKTIPCVQGRTYRFTVWYKTTADFNGDGNNSKFRLGDQGGALITAAAFATNKTDWTAATFDHTATTQTGYQLTLGLNNSVGTIWFDDVTMIDLTDVNTLNASITAEQTVRTSADSALSTRIDTLNSTVGQNTAAITAEQTARANGDSANATSITNLSTTVGGHTASITNMQSSINGVQAKAGVMLDVNGRITGWQLNNNGQSGSFEVVADRFSVSSPNGGDALTWTGGIQIARSGAYMKVTGPGFGTGNQFIEWYGPAMGVGSCSESNAVYYLKRDGSAYFGGSLSAGIFRNAVASTQVSTSAAVETGPFGTNGRGKTVVVSLSHFAAGYSQGNSAGSVNGRGLSATVAIYRSYNGGGWEQINTLFANGSITASYDPEYGRTSFSVNLSGAITFGDNYGGTGSFNYRAAIVASANWPFAMSVIFNNGPSQNLSIVSTEQ